MIPNQSYFTLFLPTQFFFKFKAIDYLNLHIYLVERSNEYFFTLLQNSYSNLSFYFVPEKSRLVKKISN